MPYTAQTLEERRHDMQIALREAADMIDGRVTSLAKRLGCSPQWLYKNTQRGEFNPDLAKRIEDATGVPRFRFNPRVFS